MPGQESLWIGPGKGKESFVGSLITAKQTFGFERREIEPIEERPIAIGRSADAPQVDRIPVLANYPGTVRQLASDWSTGVLVLLVSREIPEQTRFLLRVINVDEEAFSPVPVVIVLGQESKARLVAPGEVDITLLGASDFHRGPSEWRPQKHDLVTRRNVHIPAAAIKRSCPDQRRRIGSPPRKIARTQRNASDGNAIRQWKRGDSVSEHVR